MLLEINAWTASWTKAFADSYEETELVNNVQVGAQSVRDFDEAVGGRPTPFSAITRGL